MLFRLCEEKQKSLSKSMKTKQNSKQRKLKNKQTNKPKNNELQSPKPQYGDRQ